MKKIREQFQKKKIKTFTKKKDKIQSLKQHNEELNEKTLKLERELLQT